VADKPEGIGRSSVEEERVGWSWLMYLALAAGVLVVLNVLIVVLLVVLNAPEHDLMEE